MKNSRKLLSGISQEIRTHMNAIVGLSFLLEETNSCNIDDWKYSNQILNSCKKLIWLFESFFEISIDDNPNSAISLNRCRLNTFIDNIISEFRELMHQANKTDVILLTGNHYSDISEVYFDSTKVNRVISCLIHNAINNSKTGHVKVGYHLYYGKVTFYVLDTGQDHLKCRECLHTDDIESSLVKIVDASAAINIMLAKEIVKAMGGIIWFDPNDNTGTGAYFSIPVVAMECADISTENYFKSTAIQLN